MTYLWLFQVLVAACGIFVETHGPFSCFAQVPEPMESVIAACSLSSGGAQACEILVPRPGIEPTSPALEDKFLTTGPPGKSLPRASL